MKANSNLTITSNLGVVLVPYRVEHVEQYHRWMVRKYTESDSLNFIRCIVALLQRTCCT